MDFDSLGSLHGLLEFRMREEGLDQDHSGLVGLVRHYSAHNRSNSFGSRLHTITAIYFLRGFPFPLEVASF